MSGLFGLIEVGKHTLFAQQMALSVINSNIANANTPGYNRQRINLVTQTSLLGMFNSAGGGVAIAGIQRITDQFMLGQLARSRADHGEQQSLANAYGSLEILFGEPVDDVMGERGLGDAISDFLSSWQPVINPEMEASDASMRGLIIEAANILSHRFHNLAGGIITEATNLRTQLENNVAELNTLTASVAELNQQIESNSISDMARNDLMDIRELKLQRLAELAGAEWQYDEQEHLRVYLDGRTIVDHNSCHSLEVQTEGSIADRLQGVSITTQSGPLSIGMPGGELKGMLQLLNNEIPSLLDQLDRLASHIITGVNAIHQAATGDGGGGVDIFAGSDASTIAVNSVVLDHPENISLSGTLPDGRGIASAMFDLHSEAIASENGLTIEGFYATMIGDLGARSAGAAQLSGAAERLVTGFEQKLESSAGVNLDEELANMMVVQSSFQAASKVITLADELLATVLAML